jgi:hypothetical protein
MRVSRLPHAFCGTLSETFECALCDVTQPLGRDVVPERPAAALAAASL